MAVGVLRLQIGPCLLLLHHQRRMPSIALVTHDLMQPVEVLTLFPSFAVILLLNHPPLHLKLLFLLSGGHDGSLARCVLRQHPPSPEPCQQGLTPVQCLAERDVLSTQTWC